jgi:pyruvoyl-dependent arginine decarboxylase (PvlArgDC)
LQNQSWQNQALNALHYNTSQVGSVIPLICGTVRQQVNLIALGNFGAISELTISRGRARAANTATSTRTACA